MLERILTATIFQLFGFGFVWLMAWAWNPDLTSNTVSFIGILFGSLVWFICGSQET